MTDLSKRFISALEEIGVKNADLSKKYEISRQNVNNFMTSQKTMTQKFAEVCDGENININWLLTGNGEMFLSSTKKEACEIGYKIDVLNIKASAGAGIDNYITEVIDTIILDKTLFRTPPNTEKVKLIQVSGDSMQPTLNDGDFVIIDETKTFGTDGVYAIQMHGQILIKRLEFDLDGTVKIISDNQKYSTKTYNPKESQIPMHIIGMKTLTIQR